MDRENNHSGSKNTPSIYLLESIDAWIPIQIIYTHGHFQDCTIWVWAACVDTRNRSFSKLEKKNIKELYTIQDFLHIFYLFYLLVLFVSNIWYHLWQMPGNLLRGTLRSIKINRKILSFNIRLFKIWDVFFFQGGSIMHLR